MKTRVLLAFLAAAPAFAQDAGVQKELMQRRQATDAFDLQMRQSQEALKASPAERPVLDARQRAERQRLDNVSEQQLRDVQPATPPQLRPYELQKTDLERQPFRGPVVQVPVKPAPPPARLEPAPKGAIEPLEKPR